MCTGVMVMIATIATWVRTMTVVPTMMPRDAALDTATGAAWRCSGVAALSWSAMARASRNGSGRSHTSSTRPAAMYATAASRNGPARAGMPMLVASSPMGVTTFGPATAPMVVDTMARLTEVARRFGVARSVPA